ncbi:MAG: zf-HC2 domain-containing protein [Kofleriaceae bacterium]
MTCTQLDAFFDGELAPTAADAFRAHLATCDRCQLQLRGRMQEALVVDEAPAEAQILPIARARKRYIAAIVTVAAAAATVLIVWTLRPPPSSVHVATLEPTLKVSVSHGDTVVRGTAALAGDRVTIETPALAWIYVDDRELVQTCVQTCTVSLDRVGTYTVAAVIPGAIVPIAGRGFDADLAAAVAMGARYKVDTIVVTPRPGNVP